MGTVHLNMMLHDLLLIFLAVLGMILVMIATVLLYGFYQYRAIKNKREWETLINDRVSDAIVFSDQVTISEKEDFKKHSEEDSFRSLLLEKLVSSKKKFSGMAQEEIQKLFVNYGLYKEAIRNLNSRSPYLIAGGIQEVTAMKLTDSLPKVKQYLKHPKQQVYSEAQYAMVVFEGFKGLDFLNTLKTPLSDWQQLRLLGSLQKVPEGTDVSLNTWLESSNLSVVIFSLKLIKKFQILTCYDEVKKLLKHPCESVCINAVQTLQSIENEDTFLHFIETYPLQPVKVQLTLLKAMKSSYDKRYYDFFKSELINQQTASLKMEAAYGLLGLGCSESLKEIAQNKVASQQLKEIVKHVLQEKI